MSFHQFFHHSTKIPPNLYIVVPVAARMLQRGLLFLLFCYCSSSESERRLVVVGVFLLCELAVRAEYVHNLVDVHLLHVLTCWLEVLTWVEVSRMLSEVLADSSCHGET